MDISFLVVGWFHLFAVDSMQMSVVWHFSVLAYSVNVAGSEVC
jgi:hypothetical protein